MRRRVVVITEIISPYRIPVLNALASRSDIDLHVIFLAENDPGLRQWKVYKDEIRFSYQVLASWRRRFGKANLLVNRGVAAALRRASPDAVVCGGYNYLASWTSLAWAIRRKVPFACWVESTASDERHGYYGTELLKSFFFEKCSRFLVPGKASFDYLRSYGVPPQIIFTAPNAVDVALFSQLAGAAREHDVSLRAQLGVPHRFFLFVGRLVRSKGIFDLLRAFGELDISTRREVGLVFVGDGPARTELQQLAKRIDGGAIRFAGFVQREQLPSYYGLADMLVLPSLTEVWGLVVNEAMACGLPVIASSVAGAAVDLVHTGWNGRVVPAGGIAELAAAMAELAGNRQLLTSMGQRSRHLINAYSPEVCAAGMAEAVTVRCRA